MKNKKLFNLSAIILGAITLLSCSKAQATESVFTGTIPTRSNAQAYTATTFSTSEVVPITLGISQSEYKTNNGKVYWTIKDSNGTYKDIYCLNLERGFGAPDGNITNANNTKEYNKQYDFNAIASTQLSTITGLSTTNKNKILWILNNSLTSEDSLSVILNGASEKVEQAGWTSYVKEDMKNNDDSRTSLTFDDIKMVQQIAIWHYTNSGSIFDNTLTGICDLNGNQISSQGENILVDTDTYTNYVRSGLIKQVKLNALYQYFIDGAESGSSETLVPSLSMLKQDETITESGNSYVIGPLSLTGENTDLIKEIEVTNNNIAYTLLDASKNEVNNNDFSKVINKNFYLKVNKENINEDAKIKLKLTYKYDTRELKLLTNENDTNNTQPVVLVETVENQNELDPEIIIPLTSVSVKKIWNDNNNQDGVRPSSVKVQLYKDGKEYGNSITLNGEKLTHTWTNLLDGYEYTVKELNPSNAKLENNQKYNNDYIVTYSVSENKTTITNTHVQNTIDIIGTKTWEDNNNQDGKRPESIVVNLLANGQKVESKTVTAPWSYEFENLPKYNAGKEIEYTITEDAIIEYTTSINGYNIINTYTPGKTNKTVKKVWDDNENQDGLRTESVEVQLYKTVDGTKTSMGENYTVILNKTNSWEYTWENLELKENGKDIVYSVEETEVPAGYEVEYSNEDYSKVNVITITNTHTSSKTNKTVKKVWDDSENQDGIRPEMVEVQLYKTVDEIKTSMGENHKVTLNETNNWEYTWENLALKENGKDIVYSVEEVDIPEGYEVTYSNEDYSEVNIITITNTHIPNKLDLALRKFITQINDKTYSREPVVDTSKLGTEVNGSKVTTATYKHTKQPIVVQKGDVVTYTIRVYNEGEVDGYVEMITDHVPDNLLPITIEAEGIDKEKYADEIDFNLSWGWVPSEDGKTITTMITRKDDHETYAILTGLEEVTDTKLNAYVQGSNELDYIDVQIKCLVTDSAVDGEYLTNIAQISKMCDANGVEVETDIDSTKANADYNNLGDYKNEEAISSDTNSYVEGQEDDDDFEKLWVKEFDLSLRKFITKVNEKSYSRAPVVDTSKLGTIVDGKTKTTATYNHSKEPVIVETGDLVTYKIRIYNEGSLAGFANEITDDIPEGLEFLPDSSVNVSYRWEMLDSEGNKTEDVSKAVMIVTDYLSDIDINNIINAVSGEDGVKTLNYKDVEVQFRVIAKAEKLKDNLIINEAQISSDSDIDRDSIPNRDEKHDYTTGKNEDDIDYEPIKLQYFDLALRKFITKVNSTDYNNRYPEVIYNEDGSIKYNHTKDPVLVTTGDTIIYTIRVYNEGEKAGTATEITDNLPEGLEFLADNEINKTYGWKLLDESGNETQDLSKAIKVTTNILENEAIEGTIIKEEHKVLSYKDVQIAFKVVEENTSNKILVNTAEISKDSDDDVDSTPDNNVETEDDLDKEYVKVRYFDLALKKWVTATKVTYNGKTTITKTGFTEDSEGIAKVDLVASKMKKTTVKFTYNIKVINEGELPGSAYEVEDYIPNGLKFVQEDNKDWKEVKDGVVVTDKLKDTLLNPGESATVEITLTWKNSTTNLALKTNYAEISKDSGNDIDSTPDNYNKKEDDIDDAQVILSIKTAGATTYVGLILTSVSILAIGIFLIKKYVIK